MSPWLAICLPCCLPVSGTLFGLLFRCEDKGNTLPWNIGGPLQLQSVTTQKTVIFSHHCEDLKCDISLNEWIRGWPRPVLAPQPWHNLNVYEGMWFQHNSTPHFWCQLCIWLNNHFLDIWIGCWNHIIWPPHSLDLSPLHFFLWGCSKENDYATDIRGQPRQLFMSGTPFYIAVKHVCKLETVLFSSSCKDITQNYV